MIGLIFLIISSIGTIIEASDVRFGPRLPKLIPLNKSYALIDYIDSFAFGDFSTVVSVAFLADEINAYEKKYFAIASVEYTDEKVNEDGTYLQPLKEGWNTMNLMAKIDLCTEYKNLYIKITAASYSSISPRFKSTVDFKNMSDIDKENLICVDNEKTVVLSFEYSQDLQVKNCIRKLELCNEDTCEILSEGRNDLGGLAASEPVHIRMNDHYRKDIKLISCSEQSARRILRNTANWICVIENRTLNFFQREWEDFQIYKVYFGEIVQVISFGNNNTFEYIPMESKLIVTYTTKDAKQSYRLQFQTNIPPCQSNSAWESTTQVTVYLIVTSVIVVALVIATVVGVFFWRKQRTTVPSDTGNNEEDPSNKITRKPRAWDEDYDYDDPDQQRTVNLGNGVFKEYLTDTTYYLKFRKGEQDNRSQNSNDYGDDEDYYKDNYNNDNYKEDYYKDNYYKDNYKEDYYKDNGSDHSSRS